MKSILKELRRRQVFQTAALYVVAAWVIIQVAGEAQEAFELPRLALQYVWIAALIGFPLALIFGWYYDITSNGIVHTPPAHADAYVDPSLTRTDYLVFSAFFLVVIFIAYPIISEIAKTEGGRLETSAVREVRENSIAVLPFTNLSSDPEQEYFSDGISEELLNLLAKIPELSVISRTSAFSYKGKDVRLSEIARELNVAHILEGSVRKAGNTVRITAQLIDVRTDTHLWSESYDRELEDIFTIQDEISGHIVRALKVTLGAGKQGVMAQAQKPTEDLEAYELYLRGRYFWQRRGEDNIRHAIDLLEQATALDPQFAQAWSSLAAAHATLPSYSDVSQAEQHLLAATYAHKALALNDSLAEAYAVLGDATYLLDRKWADAEAYYLRAIAHEPKNATAHLWYGQFLRWVGRTSDALEETLIAYQLDPLNAGTNFVLTYSYWRLDDTSNVLKYGTAAWDLGNIKGLYYLIWAHLRLGEFDRAMEFAEQYDELTDFPVGIAVLAVEAKMDAAKRPLFLKMLAEHESRFPLFISLSGYVTFGRIDDAFRLANLNLDSTRWMYWQPEMAPFRRDPRFEKLVTEQGLLDYWRENGWPDACLPEGNSLSCE